MDLKRLEAQGLIEKASFSSGQVRSNLYCSAPDQTGLTFVFIKDILWISSQEVSLW